MEPASETNEVNPSHLVQHHRAQQSNERVKTYRRTAAGQKKKDALNARRYRNAPETVCPSPCAASATTKPLPWVCMHRNLASLVLEPLIEAGKLYADNRGNTRMEAGVVFSKRSIKPSRQAAGDFRRLIGWRASGAESGDWRPASGGLAVARV